MGAKNSLWFPEGLSWFLGGVPMWGGTKQGKGKIVRLALPRCFSHRGKKMCSDRGKTQMYQCQPKTILWPLPQLANLMSW